eukprot:GILJ01011208.1.p1 GENE.GILJ01011208.1~~GILJ01011208.1.p1  ORF type:complete len:660 (+),score=72.48 GILJ01011208.1:80-2059(+)
MALVYLTCTTAGSKKFWCCEVKGEEAVIKFGRIGTVGQIQRKQFTSTTDALAFHGKAVSDKIQAGYSRKEAPECLNQHRDVEFSTIATDSTVRLVGRKSERQVIDVSDGEDSPNKRIKTISPPPTSPLVQHKMLSPEPPSADDLRSIARQNFRQFLEQWHVDPQYIDILESEAIDLSCLKLLSESDLKDIGLPLGPRKKVLAAIDSLTMASAPNSTTTSMTSTHLPPATSPRMDKKEVKDKQSASKSPIKDLRSWLIQTPPTTPPTKRRSFDGTDSSMDEGSMKPLKKEQQKLRTTSPSTVTTSSTNLSTPSRAKKTESSSPNEKGAKAEGEFTANDTVIKTLSELYTNVKNSTDPTDRWRSKAYASALTILKSYNKPLTVEAARQGIKGVGKKTNEKIVEILESGKLQRLEEQKKDERYASINLYARIWGAGPKACERWYTLGYRTYEDLLSHNELNQQQKVGLKYVDEFEQRIPREEVQMLEEVIRSAAVKVDSKLQLQICGSYRRERPTCGDIDVVLYHPEGGHRQSFFRLIERLRKDKFLTDDLATPTTSSSSKYMGVCMHPERGVHRRIDMRMIDPEAWGCALLHFTGSDMFNVSMRKHALIYGFKLSEYALVKVSDDGTQTDIPVVTEQDVFDVLGLDYVAPRDREGKHPQCS